MENADLRVNARITIPRAEIHFSFVRSSGPGGQNVNKVASKAVLRWRVSVSPSIPDHLRARLLSVHARRVNSRGEFILTSQRYRDQARNIQDCLDKLQALIAETAKVPKRRKRTGVPQRVQEERLRQKRSISARKASRRKISDED